MRYSFPPQSGIKIWIPKYNNEPTEKRESQNSNRFGKELRVWMIVIT